MFIAQHRPPLFRTMLAEYFASSSGVSVVEAEHGGVVEAGRAYIAPGSYHLVVGFDSRL